MAANPPNENLSVSGLPADITDEKVRTIFAQYGLVAQAKVLPPGPCQLDREAFLRMSSLDEAKWMVENINDNVLDGMVNPVCVRYSAHKGPLSPWGGLPQSVFASPAPVVALASPYGVVPPAAQGKTPIQILANAVANAIVPPAGGCIVQQPVPIGVMLTGTVKRWDAAKGFGFVGADCGGPDVFVHARELSDGEVLIPGSKVVFEAQLDVARGPGKYRARTCVGAKPKPMITASAVIAAAAQAAAGVMLPAGMPGAGFASAGPVVVAPPSTPLANQASDRLFIQGVPLDSTEESLTAVFSQYGPLVSVQKMHPAPGVSYASCLVHFQIASQAKWLLENVNHNIPLGLDTPVAISYAGLAMPKVQDADFGYGKAPLGQAAWASGGPY